MRVRANACLRRSAHGLTLVAMVLATVAPAHAFFPWGGFQTVDNQRVYARWSIERFDRNNDGEIFGDGDGIDILIETGESGFTNAEREIVRNAFQVWEDIPGAYAAFRFPDTLSDPLFPGLGDIPVPVPAESISQTSMDLFNYVSISIPDTVNELPLPDGVLGIALITAVIDPVIVPVGDLFVEVDGGQTLDCDIVIVGERVRPELLPEGEVLYDLEGIMVHEIGHLLGIGHNPLNNFRLDDEGDPTFVEDAELTIRTTSGDLDVVGVTPTMFPIIFDTNIGDEELGLVVNGSASLAPDDISAAMFLYPRTGELDSFFTVRQEARTQSSPGFPTRPLLGGFVQAWVDHDNVPSTARLPLISTLTGLYVNDAPQAHGRFDMVGLPKVLLDQAGVPFNASYVFTINPLNGFDAAGQPAFIIDTMHNTFNPPVDERDAGLYDVFFASEVFREDGNILDQSNREQGTPLYFDPLRRAVVSVNSGKSLSQILPAPEPMFGDAVYDEVCPLDVIVGIPVDDGDDGGDDGGIGNGGGGGIVRPAGVITLDGIRGFRDNVLMESAVGVAMVDTYYRMGPAAAHYLRDHPTVLAGFRAAWHGFGFLASAVWLHAGALAVFAAWMIRRRRIAAGLAAVLVAVALWVQPAGAVIEKLNAEEMVERADDIVVAKVKSAESHFDGSGMIVTSYTFEVTEAVKGVMNKRSDMYMTLPGGRVGALVTHASELPTFKQGDEVLLFLDLSLHTGPSVTAGKRGRYDVLTDPDTGKKYVPALTDAAQLGHKASREALKARKDGTAKSASIDPRVPLDEFLSLVRDTAAKQAKAEQ